MALTELVVSVDEAGEREGEEINKTYDEWSNEAEREHCDDRVRSTEFARNSERAPTISEIAMRGRVTAWEFLPIAVAEEIRLHMMARAESVYVSVHQAWRIPPPRRRPTIAAMYDFMMMLPSGIGD